MSKFGNIAGQRFGRLLVLRYVGKGPLYECRCDCGKTKTVIAYPLIHGITKSCGCLQKELRTKHGHSVKGSETPSYASWRQMIQRCTNPKATGYERWGGRGITVCPRWRDSFSVFLEEMGARPSRLHSVERIDNDKGYLCGKPDCCGQDETNCRWGTKAEQGRNRVTTKLNVAKVVEIRQRVARGEMRKEIAASYGITPSTVHDVARRRSWANV